MVAMSKIESDESGHSYFNRVKQAGMLCRTTEFQKWAAEEAPELGEEINEANAVTFVCESCLIESRTELNGNKAAQKLFDDLVRDFEGRANNVPF
jgi:hypothetical protein